MIEDKKRRLLAGEQVICSDADLDELGVDDELFSNLRSVPNPKRLGLLDAYVASIKPFDEAMP